VVALAIVALFVLSALPVLPEEVTVTDTAEAAGPYYVKVGFIQDFSFWNPLNLKMVSDYVACFLMHSVLFQYDENWEGPVNDLATGYYQVINPSGNMTTYINITSNAYFRNSVDPLDTSHPLTAADVAFTINLILDTPGGTWDNYLKNITGANATGLHQVAIDTSFPKATLIDDLVWIPILPQYVWDGTPNPLGQKKPEFLVGSGLMYYNSSSKGSWYRFTKAPNYHGSTDYPLGDPRGDRVVGVDGVLGSDGPVNSHEQRPRGLHRHLRRAEPVPQPGLRLILEAGHERDGDNRRGHQRHPPGVQEDLGRRLRPR
jgi:hypothetical protein